MHYAHIVIISDPFHLNCYIEVASENMCGIRDRVSRVTQYVTPF